MSLTFGDDVTISIHAPSRERLAVYLDSSVLLAISIHAPSRERHAGAGYSSMDLVFQSTLPHGSDRCYIAYTDIFKAISIHAPSRERHSITPFIKSGGVNFNPRSLTGATLYMVTWV